VEWFPFDEQSCDMKFGSWTYDGNQAGVEIWRRRKIVTSEVLFLCLSHF
jgi:hypothetical protein